MGLCLERMQPSPCLGTIPLVLALSFYLDEVVLLSQVDALRPKPLCAWREAFAARYCGRHLAPASTLPGFPAADRHFVVAEC